MANSNEDIDPKLAIKKWKRWIFLAGLIVVIIIFPLINTGGLYLQKKEVEERLAKTKDQSITALKQLVTPTTSGGKRSVPVTAPYGVDQTGNPVCSEKVDISGNLDYNFRPAAGEPGGCILVVLNGKQNKVCREESIPLGLKKLKNQEKAEIQFCSLENRQIRMVLDIYQAGV